MSRNSELATADRTPTEQAADRDHDQERLNSATHAVGLLLSIAGAAVLAVAAINVNWATAIVCTWYALLLMVVYAVSTLSHAVSAPRARMWFRIWDQGLIYLLIAGTYTPLIWMHVPGSERIVWLAIVWLAAIAGLVSKVVWHHRVHAVATWGYLLLGWGPAMALVRYVPAGCFLWLVLGGLCYSIGVLFLKTDHKCRYFHAVWHVLVILGSSFHYTAILLYVVGISWFPA